MFWWIFCERQFEMDWLPYYAEIKIAMKLINTGRAPRFDHLVERENVTQAVFKLITECWNEYPLPDDRLIVLEWLCRRAKVKKEFDITTVESPFLDTFGNFETSVLQSFQNHKGVKDLAGEQLTNFWPGRCRRNALRNGFLYTRFSSISQKFFDTVNKGWTMNDTRKDRVPTNICVYFKAVTQKSEVQSCHEYQVVGWYSNRLRCKIWRYLGPTLFSIFFSVMLTYAF